MLNLSQYRKFFDTIYKMMHDGEETSPATEKIDPQVNDKNNNGFICGVVEGFYGKPWTFEQRKDLFKKLKEFKLNTFMYAPKDDAKHRAKWRQLYSTVEEQELKILIDEAKMNGIEFYYSLAPGLDMIYSDDEELRTLTRKFEQLLSLGCSSFAILFDDIEPSICNERDRGVFENYANAQVLVSNHIYQHLKCPKFLFCPTEYCESRAVPDVPNSTYLQTIGAGLPSGIDIMWSGSRVISKLITEESIDILTKVIKRPPVIWENLHANDYDKKRVYLGPYTGRSTKIIPNLRGVLTNPNCEYEANYIAIHTLAQWSRCKEDVDKQNFCQTHIDQFLSSSSASPNYLTSTQTSPVYDPEKALVLAIKDWLPQVLQNKALRTSVDSTTGVQIVENHMQYSTTAPNTIEQINFENLSLLVDLFYLPFQHGQRGQTLLKELRWLKDCSESLNREPVDEHNEETPMNQDGDECMIEQDKRLQQHQTFNEAACWSERVEKLNNLCLSIATLVNSLIVSYYSFTISDKLYYIHNLLMNLRILYPFNIYQYECPNKLLIMDLYPYLTDARDMTVMITDYIKFISKCFGNNFCIWNI